MINRIDKLLNILKKFLPILFKSKEVAISWALTSRQRFRCYIRVYGSSPTMPPLYLEQKCTAKDIAVYNIVAMLHWPKYSIQHVCVNMKRRNSNYTLFTLSFITNTETHQSKYLVVSSYILIILMQYNRSNIRTTFSGSLRNQYRFPLMKLL